MISRYSIATFGTPQLLVVSYGGSGGERTSHIIPYVRIWLEYQGGEAGKGRCVKCFSAFVQWIGRGDSRTLCPGHVHDPSPQATEVLQLRLDQAKSTSLTCTCNSVACSPLPVARCLLRHCSSALHCTATTTCCVSLPSLFGPLSLLDHQRRTATVP